MGIFSRDRSGSYTGTFSVNEGYVNTADITRALYESEINNHRIFEAVLASDFHEIRARQEGTLLESEISALNEANVKAFFEKLIQKLKNFWEKVKGVFKAAYARLSSYIVRNGKTFLKMHEKDLVESKVNGCELKNYKKRTSKIFVTPEVVSKLLSGDIKASSSELSRQNGYKSDDLSDFEKELYNSMMSKHKGDTDSSNFVKNALDECFEEKATVKMGTDVKLADLKKTLSDGSKTIKDLKEAEKKMEKKVKDAIKSLKDAEKKASKKDGDEAAEESSVLSAARKLVTIFESISSKVTTVNIKATRMQLSQDRAALGRCVAWAARGGASKEDKKDAEVVGESFWLEGVAEVEEVMDSPADSIEEIMPDATPEEMAEVEEILADAGADDDE